MTVQVLLFVAIFQTGARPVLAALAAPGRMTLTLYVLQSVIFVPVFYGFGLGLWDKVTLAQCLWIGIVAFGVQIVAAHLWFRAFRYGPLEWAWRAATRMTLNIPSVPSSRQRMNAENRWTA
ncbi:DUF418 domain-containing protein [Sphingomonas daechungensis]|uniref:DUF418 domain-containing protein n=1 Tax=Sphingomonas daechungensis TaxID=1176646 RepID=UPI0021D53883|nr:DUF418 domain-containing protein [Sphingomonas daechungensis]